MSSRRHPARTIWRDASGSAAVEFAFIAPALLMLLVGALNLALTMFTIGSMHYAVEEAARCASVKTTICTDSASTIAYARSHYFSTVVTATFSYAAVACGNQVSATATYTLNTGISAINIPLSASDCFP